MVSSIHLSERRDRRGRWFAALAMLLSIAVLGASWLGLFTFMSASAAAGTWQALDEQFIPEIDASELVLPDLSRTSRIYSADGQLLATLHDGRITEPVPFDEVPLQVRYAVLAAEDGDFFEHEGIDFGSIAAAARANILFGTTRGGSTITQQVVKQNIVGDELSYARKLKEALTAIELERRYTKETILEFYMNSVYFGYGAYGVKAAAREFFDKDLDQLTVAEAAAMAVIIRSPGLYDPRRDPEGNLEKRDEVIRLMLRDGRITQAVADQALAEPLRVVPRRAEPPLAEHVVAEVRRQLLDLGNRRFDFLGTTFDERKKAIFGCPADDTSCTGGGGLQIHTTIDLGLQQEAQRILQEWVPTPDDPDEDAPTGAIAMVDNWTGAVRVMASGLPFEREQFDLAIQGRRNPGSAFKPIAMMAALENGQTLGSFWNATSPFEFECPDTCYPTGTWRVTNAGGAGTGLMRLDEATYRSVNVVYAGLSLEIGPQEIVDTAQRMGIKSPLESVPSISLGGSAVSPLEMASAYSTFATNGLNTESYLVERIDLVDSGTVYQHEAIPQQIFDPAMVAAGRQPLLRVPTSSGTASRANIGVPQGGKTGTHSRNRDVWYVGFVPRYSTAVWVGYPDEQRELTNVTIRGERYSRLFGGTVPGPIWAEFMRVVLADEDPGDFPADPTGVDEYFRTPTTEVPDLMALAFPPEEMVDEITKALLTAHLNPDVQEVPSLEPAGTILSISVEPGTEVAQGTTILVEISSGVPATGPLPDLVGSTLAQVDAILAQLAEQQRITLTYLVQFVDTWEPDEFGRVLSSTPPPGSTVTDGGALTLRVGRAATGPPPTIPPEQP